jgi:hypothetical protein
VLTQRIRALVFTPIAIVLVAATSAFAQTGGIVAVASANAHSTVASHGSRTSSDSEQAAPFVPARNAPHTDFARGWVDVNFGVSGSATKTFSAELAAPLFLETRTARATYHNPRGAEFDFGGGFMLTPNIGLGISFSGTAREDSASLFVDVPHPFQFNAFASDTAPTDSKLQRTEGGAHIQVVGVAPLGDRVRLRVFGGPTYFRVQQDMVQSIAYDQAFLVFVPVNAVDITTYDSVDKVEGTGWGFHVGSDVTVFFSRFVGVGSFVRFSRGTVSLEDPLSGEAIHVTAGGVQAGGGLRLRF